jgi:hypothetical protein
MSKMKFGLWIMGGDSRDLKDISPNNWSDENGVGCISPVFGLTTNDTENCSLGTD